MSRDDGTELALSGVTNGSLDDKGELREQLSRASQEIHRLQEELRREREETRTKNSTQDAFLSQAFGTLYNKRIAICLLSGYRRAHPLLTSQQSLDEGQIKDLARIMKACMPELSRVAEYYLSASIRNLAGAEIIAHPWSLSPNAAEPPASARSLHPLLFPPHGKCICCDAEGSLVLGMMLKRRNLIKAVFVEEASSSSSSSSSSLDVYVTPKRIIYERYLLEELTADTSPTSAQLQDGLASIGVAVGAYNNGATPNESEWVAQAKAGALWKVEDGTSSYVEVAEPVDPRSFPFWTRINVEEVRRKFAFDNIAGNFVTAADMNAWFPVASQEATEQPVIQF